MKSRTVYTVLEETAQRYGGLPALHQPLGKGKYQTWTWSEFRQAAEEIACGLRALGVAKGEIIAHYSETRAEFYLADIGVMAAGAVSAALYTSYPLPDQIRNLRGSGAATVFVENPKSLRTLSAAAREHGLPLRFILLTGEDEVALTLEEVRKRGREALRFDPHYFEKIRASYNADAYAVLYLTSGATGEPKMGIVTHAALVGNMDMGPVALPLTTDDCTLVFLPSG
jgi:long-chain acyl-CoA synthetase